MMTDPSPALRLKTDAEGISMANDTPTLTPPPLAGEGREGARRLFLQPRHRPHLARRRGARIRHRRHQRGHHLDRDRPLRRHEGKRHRPLIPGGEFTGGERVPEALVAVLCPYAAGFRFS
jgi:hypothetical protein